MDQKKVKNIWDNKLLTAILSLVIAFGLWLYVVTTNSTDFEETFYNIDVVHMNESLLADRGLMIVENQTPDVDLTLFGNRTDINKLNSSNITVTVDLSTIWEPGTVALEYKVSYPGDVANNAINIQGRNPARVNLKIEQKIIKPVPVQVNYANSVPEGFLADKEKVELEYTELMISGPKSVIDQIACARIDVDLQDQKQSIGGQFPFTLCDEKGEPVDAALVSVPVEQVGMTLKILRVKELALKVNIENGGGATDKTSSIEISPRTIQVSGSDALLEDLDEIVVGTIKLGELLKDETMTFPIQIPDGVTNETGVSEATVEIKFPDLAIRTFTVTDIRAINVPAGLKVDMITQALEVQIRGPKVLMKNMTEADIIITVDFENEPVGTATKKATITMSGDFLEAGAVGVYQVLATVKPAGG